jgi:hypothetical protein
MNLAGAICFSPPVTFLRRQFGLMEPHPFYLWVLTAWILAFGVAFFLQGWTGQANRGILALGVWGKGIFAGFMFGMAAAGEATPFAAMSAGPDLVLAGVFAIWLWRTRSQTHVPISNFAN